MKKILIIFLSIILTGCYNYHELNTVGIISSLLFDYEDNEYKVTAQISGEKELDVIEGHGKNVSEALNQAGLAADKDLSFYHLKVVFITPDVNLEEVLSFLVRDPKINNNFYVLYTTDKEIISKNKDSDVGNDMNDLLKKELNYTFFDLTNAIYNDNIDFFLPIINEKLIVEGMMPYDKYKSTTPLDNNDINIFRILNNDIDSYIRVECGNGMMVVNVNSNDIKFKVNEKLEINIDMKVSIIEYDSNIKNYDFEGIKKLESCINDETEDIVYKLIKKLQDSNSDILGIDRYIYNKKHNLNKTWKTYDYKINVNSKINKKGLILE